MLFFGFPHGNLVAQVAAIESPVELFQKYPSICSLWFLSLMAINLDNMLNNRICEALVDGLGSRENNFSLPLELIWF